MKTLRLFAVDVREGFATLWPWYVVAIVFFALCNGSLYLQAALFRLDAIAFTFGDFLVNLTVGMSPFSPLQGEPFRFPIAWAVLFLLVAYMTLWYPYRDLMGPGKQVLVMGGSRWAWWLAKCAWVASAVSAFFLAAVLTTAVWTLVSGGAFTLRISEQLPLILNCRAAPGITPTYDMRAFLLAVPGVTLALCCAQLLLSLLVRPPLSYVATVSILFLSAFFFNPWLMGNYLMAARSLAMTSDGMQAIQGAVLAAVVVVMVVVGGGLVFSRKDILKKEDLS